MGRKSLLAAVAGLFAAVWPQAPATAQSASHLFIGTLGVTAVTPQCAPVGIKRDAIDAMFRPHLQASDPNAAVIVTGDRGILVQLQNQSTTNMQGSGSYNGIYYDAGLGQVLPWTGTYSLAVKPSTVSSTTIFITATGTINNFANVADCTLTINAGFIQPVGP